jgi:futalosine hydrolase
VTLLVVTAVEAERDALAGLGTVIACGVGAAAAAAATAYALARGDYDAVLSAGIGGGFAHRVPVGGTVLGTASVIADLGAESPDGFLPLDELGFGPVALPADAGLLATLTGVLPEAVTGEVLTTSTVTGTAETAEVLARRHPDAVAEGMEGFGVATAAAYRDVPFAELRTVSNAIGPRDRAAWRMREALDALALAGRALATLDW